MYSPLLSFHSILRYVALILLLLAIFNAWKGWMGKKEFSKQDEKIALFTMIAFHLQLLTGLTLYFISPFVMLDDLGSAMKDEHLRFWTVEHTSMMLIAVILVTQGRSLAKKAEEAVTQHKRIAIFFTIALLLILAAIPWPFSSISRPWF